MKVAGSYFLFIMKVASVTSIITGKNHQGVIHAAIMISRIHQSISPNIVLSPIFYLPFLIISLMRFASFFGMQRQSFSQYFSSKAKSSSKSA